MHQTKLRADMNAQIRTAVKEKARESIFKSGQSIVDEVIGNKLDDVPGPSCPKPANLIRMANRARQADRPAEPKDLDFEVALHVILDNFIQKDMIVDGARHLIFCSPEQKAVLDKAKTLYLDGTFKIISSPFTQLLGIHSFVKGDASDALKQIPLVFVMMSRRSRKDYKKVLKKVKKMLPSKGANITTAVVDFEMALWQAIREVLPEGENPRLSVPLDTGSVEEVPRFWPEVTVRIRSHHIGIRKEADGAALLAC